MDSTPRIPGHEITAALNPALLKTYSQTFFLYACYRDAVNSQPWEQMANLPPAPVEKDFGADCSTLPPLILCPSILQLLVSGSLTSALCNKMCCTVPFSQTLLYPPWKSTASQIRGFHLGSIYCSHSVLHPVLQHWCFPYNHTEIQYIFLPHEKQGQASSMQTLLIIHHTHHLAALCVHLQEPTCLCPVIFV